MRDQVGHCANIISGVVVKVVVGDGVIRVVIDIIGGNR